VKAGERPFVADQCPPFAVSGKRDIDDKTVLAGSTDERHRERWRQGKETRGKRQGVDV
jgi:hypothetical protein